VDIPPRAVGDCCVSQIQTQTATLSPHYQPLVSTPFVNNPGDQYHVHSRVNHLHCQARLRDRRLFRVGGKVV
jgi:hypothetical protein